VYCLQLPPLPPHWSYSFSAAAPAGLGELLLLDGAGLLLAGAVEGAVEGLGVGEAGLGEEEVDGEGEEEAGVAVVELGVAVVVAPSRHCQYHCRCDERAAPVRPQLILTVEGVGLPSGALCPTGLRFYVQSHVWLPLI
jgi:hypothetical protein